MKAGGLRALGWLGGLVAAIALLRLAAVGALAAPPPSLDGLTGWVEARQPGEVALALVRLAAEATAWYLLAVTALHVVATAFRFRPATALADAITTPRVGEVVRGALGLGLATTALVTPSSPPGLLVRAGATPASAAVDDEAAERVERPGTAGMRPQPVDRGTATMRPVVPTAPIPTAEVEAPARSTWRVDRGESFWSIASDVLEEAWQRPPTDREVDPFWRLLVDANRDRLVDLRDPDLIHPGQVFAVPSPPPDDRADG